MEAGPPEGSRPTLLTEDFYFEGAHHVDEGDDDSSGSSDTLQHTVSLCVCSGLSPMEIVSHHVKM